MSQIDIRVLELLTARLCHELVGPIAAVGNGVELLVEEGAGFSNEAATLVADSARRAGNRLRFYRFAYGFGGDGEFFGAAPWDLATGLFDAPKIECEYPAPLRSLSPAWHKFCCNLLLLGAESLPRGGRLALTMGAGGPDLEAIGDAAALPPEKAAAMILATPTDALTPRTIQGYFTGLLARALSCRLVVGAALPGRFRLGTIALAG